MESYQLFELMQQHFDLPTAYENIDLVIKAPFNGTVDFQVTMCDVPCAPAVTEPPVAPEPLVPPTAIPVGDASESAEGTPVGDASESAEGTPVGDNPIVHSTFEDLKKETTEILTEENKGEPQ